MNELEGVKVLILVNKETTILQFRLEVVNALIKAGCCVWVSTPAGDRISEIEAVGAGIVDTPIKRDGTNPVEDLKLLWFYKQIMKKYNPDVVLTYTIKPNVYGGMAAASLRIPYVANITGLGAVLGNEGPIQKLALILYRCGMRRVSQVFFQNSENQAFFEKHKLAMGHHASLPGSGVNLTRFSLVDYPPEETVDFAFISRIRKEKGIDQYIDAARAIKAKYPEARFHVCGYGSEEEENKIRELHDKGLLIYHGFLKDIRVMLKDVHCVIHPTYYPEGMSNVLLESAASGRAIISTDRAGCREAIDHGVNGYLVREQDSSDLIEKVEQFMQLTYEEKKTMGLKGREKVAREFDRNIVVNRYLETVAELIDKSN